MCTALIISPLIESKVEIEQWLIARDLSDTIPLISTLELLDMWTFLHKVTSKECYSLVITQYYVSYLSHNSQKLLHKKTKHVSAPQIDAYRVLYSLSILFSSNIAVMLVTVTLESAWKSILAPIIIYYFRNFIHCGNSIANPHLRLREKILNNWDRPFDYSGTRSTFTTSSFCVESPWWQEVPCRWMKLKEESLHVSTSSWTLSRGCNNHPDSPSDLIVNCDQTQHVYCIRAF